MYALFISREGNASCSTFTFDLTHMNIEDLIISHVSRQQQNQKLLN